MTFGPDFWYAATTWVLPVLFAVTLHEAAHGYVAWKLGDDTAYRRGRVSFNPLRHVDPFGTVILPAMLLLLRAPFLFGWAKPVPVNFRNLREPRLGMVLVAAAGPGANLLLALACGLAFHVVPILPESAREWTVHTLFNGIRLNAILAVFNMLPLPPLDGGRVAVGLLPRPLALPLARLEKYGLAIILALVFLLPMLGRAIGVPLDLFFWLVGAPAGLLIDLVLLLTGHG